MNDSRALIIFIRRPELGQVKTRLAKTIGDLKALRIYQELLKHTHSIAKEARCEKYLYYSGDTDPDDQWENDLFHKASQVSGTLGEKMQSAFAAVFALGHREVVIIGSDCYDLTPEFIEHAFARLKICPLVIGPALDGGYYLMGMTRLFADLFDLNSWGSSVVLEQTIKIADGLKINYALLERLNDVDTEHDLSGSPVLQRLAL